MKPRVYLGGPIFDQPDHVCAEWRDYFKQCKDFDWVDPMRRDYRGKEDSHYAEIVEGDKADIDTCQVVITHLKIIGAGTSQENLWAWLNTTPVISIVNDKVSPWIRYHSTHLVKTEEAALAVLKEMFA